MTAVGADAGGAAGRLFNHMAGERAIFHSQRRFISRAVHLGPDYTRLGHFGRLWSGQHGQCRLFRRRLKMAITVSHEGSATLTGPQFASRPGKVRVATYRVTGYRVFCAVVFAAFTTMFLLQATNGFAVGYGLAAIAFCLLVRTIELRVVVTAQHVLVRSWLYNRGIDRASIIRACVVPYRGAWARGGAIFWLEELAFERVNGTSLTVPAIIGLRRRDGGIVQKIVSDFNARTGVTDEALRSSGSSSS